MRNKKNKYKFFKKGYGDEPTVIEFNLSKAVLLLIFISIIVIGIITKEIVTITIEARQRTVLANEEETTDNDIQTMAEANGESGIITSAEFTDIKTGVGPFDENDEPGNDSSEGNNIVRSFDQITWTMELTFGLKSGVTEANLKGGVIEVQAELPESLANIVEWDISSMQWLENATLSSDGISLTGNYKMEDTEVTIPGKKSVIFVLKVQNAINGTEIQPTFTMKLTGNDDTEAISKTADIVFVSATGKYNIELHRNTNIANKTTLDYGQGDTEGRMYGYGFTVQLYNDNESKGLKGLEYPQGEISFDIDLKLERSQLESSDLEDITAEATPILWNYRVNDGNTDNLSGNISEREMFFEGGSTSVYDYELPLGIDNGDRDRSTYNSGNINITQQETTLHVTVNNYDFDGEFPRYGSQSYMTKKYTDNIGIFSVGYIQLFVPDTEANTIEDRNYYLTVTDDNMSVTSMTGNTITSQMSISDDSSTVQHLIFKQGTYAQNLYIRNKEGVYASVESGYGTGDGKVAVGNIITVQTRFFIGTDGDYDIYTANRFVKFDGEAYEPIYYDDGRQYKGIGLGNPKFNVWYVCKKDGTNWSSQEEMNNGNIEDMELYGTIEEIPSDNLCIGMYFELIEGYIARISGNNNSIEFWLKIKETAEIGKTYGITQRTWLWKETLDRNVYTVTNENVTWPETEWDPGNRQYIKTEYDENGNMIAGTHNGGTSYGNTLLVVGANLYGNIRAIDDTNTEKVNYDIGKNENIVTYSVEPYLDKNENIIIQIEDVVLKAEVTIPNGLSYVLGSSMRGEATYTEPEITENVDGSITLVWYLYGITSGETIEPITFNAQISNSSSNGTQYETKFVISENIEDGEIAKIGNSEITNRTSTETISIINLASFRLYKEVETPIIDKNGSFHFKITGKNNTDVSLSEFALLDIMPYNGDSRGTSYNGTYQIDQIVITQNINGTEADNTNLKLYISQDESVKNVTVSNIDTNSIWKEIQETNSIYEINVEQTNTGVTGIAIKGELIGQTEIIIDIYGTTIDSQPGDKYVNLASAQTQSTTDAIQTSKEQVQVIGRTINGKIWLDENYNSVLDENESLGTLNKDEIFINLYKIDESGNIEEAVNINGEIIQARNPDENGNYIFDKLAAEDYIIKIEYNGEIYKLVEKEKGSNIEINSKFEQEEKGKGTTETITKLNSVSNSIIEESNVNAGLCEIINLEFTKIAEEDNTNKIGGTEFKLYKLICTTHEEGYHNNREIEEDIDQGCWELIDTQSSSLGILNSEETGKVVFQDISINEEYRLVETKASLNRIKPNGEWKIEFIYVNDTANQPSIMLNDVIGIQITAIGNPPAFINQEGNLLLPNRALFNLPTSGSIESLVFYGSGISIILIGILLLISRKYLFSNKHTKKNI